MGTLPIYDFLFFNDDEGFLEGGISSTLLENVELVSDGSAKIKSISSPLLDNLGLLSNSKVGIKGIDSSVLAGLILSSVSKNNVKGISSPILDNLSLLSNGLLSTIINAPIISIKDSSNWDFKRKLKFIYPEIFAVCNTTLSDCSLISYGKNKQFLYKKKIYSEEEMLLLIAELIN